MLKIEMQFEDGKKEIREFALPFEIGRLAGCGLRLRSWRVAKKHARLEARDAGVFIEDLGAITGTMLNGQRISRHGPLQEGDEIIIGPCMMKIRQICSQQDRADRQEGQDEVASSTATLTGVKHASDQGLLEQDLSLRSQTAQSIAAVPEKSRQDLTQHLYIRRRLHGALLEALDLRRRDVSMMSDEALRSEAGGLLDDIIQADEDIPADTDRQRLMQEVLDEAVGLGPLEPLLQDANITEIMVNRHDEIYVEKNGCLQRHDAVFSSEQAVVGVIDRIVAPIGRRIDESSPMVDARLADGSRVNAIIPPIALRGASITIRKFPLQRPAMQDLLKLGSLDTCMSRFLESCVRLRKNIVVSGGTGSGKTTLLNILSNCIPPQERIVTIEDAAELRLNHEHLVALEARPANLEGRGQVMIRDLVRNALRMRPDRIVVGECRGAEAFDMLGAMNTGHEGSLTTLHANTPRDALARLETMILMAGMDLPLLAVREHIAASIEFIIQQTRLSNGRRVVTSIVEVGGMENGVIKTQEIFAFERKGGGVFAGAGIIPNCFERMRQEGFDFDPALFSQRSDAQSYAASFNDIVSH
ncbi:Flp pilus assembly complex ATPase component TadA [Advenella sp. WQ 585]|uniref:Flp pilus assembly complex ATPase component TadA n=1 Tax=Advenella mandrilli TaxID=2800330 RepID=A0ABS1EEK2_9BURK|nr:ATPase, T2SS/T4P/T4SS family [Advenella mandrilli]MBK1780671.1 Flp pilus assembly complex ATPase component TadA [Advenella mandrilli]